MATAMVSAFTGRLVRGGLAMTVEIALSGQVLPVGGLLHKVLAVHRCGLARVILPHGIGTASRSTRSSETTSPAR